MIVKCPNCGVENSVPDGLSRGERVRCGSCGEELRGPEKKRPRGYVLTGVLILALIGLGILAGVLLSDDNDAVIRRLQNQLDGLATRVETLEEGAGSTVTPPLVPTPTPSPTPTPTPTPPPLDSSMVVILNHSMTDTGPYFGRVEGAVKNASLGRFESPRVEVNCKFYDSDGNYLDSAFTLIPADLESGETWLFSIAGYWSSATPAARYDLETDWYLPAQATQ